MPLALVAPGSNVPGAVLLGDIMRTYVIGDIHGQLELLMALHERIARDDVRQALLATGKFIQVRPLRFEV